MKVGEQARLVGGDNTDSGDDARSIRTQTGTPRSNANAKSIQSDWGLPSTDDTVWGSPLTGDDIIGQQLDRNVGSAKSSDFVGEQHSATYMAKNEFASAGNSNLHGSAVSHQEDASTDSNPDRMHKEIELGTQDYDLLHQNSEIKQADGYKQANTADIRADVRASLLNPTGIKNAYKNDDGSLTNTKHTEAQIHNGEKFAVGDASDNGKHGIREFSKGETKTYGDNHYDAGVAVPHHCVRREAGAGSNIIEVVPYGWSGVGHGNKYCYLEHCNACTSPVKIAGLTDPNNSEGSNEHANRAASLGKYCEMATTHSSTEYSSDQGRASDGSCGKHQFEDTCTYVSCKYDGTGPMEVVVAQQSTRGDSSTLRALGHYPEISNFKNGKDHECRPAHDANGNWSCKCTCSGTNSGLPKHSVSNQN